MKKRRRQERLYYQIYRTVRRCLLMNRILAGSEAQYNLKQGIHLIFPSSLQSITEMSLPPPQITDVTSH